MNNKNFIYETQLMCESFARRVLEISKIFGKFDIVHGHDWHIVKALDILKSNGYKIVDR